MIQRYNNINEFVEDLNKPNTQLMESRNESTRESDGTTKFTGTTSYNEASDLLLYGDKDSTKLLTDSVTTLERTNTGRATYTPAVAGCAPLVPAAVMGLPLSMLQRSRRPVAPVIEAKYNISFDWSISAKDAAKTAAKYLTACKALQAAGYRLKIILCLYSKNKSTDSNTDGFEIVVKEAGEPLNLNRLGYMICNASMTRRHSFKWIETHVNKGSEYPKNYGFPVNKDTNGAMCYYTVKELSTNEIIEKIKKTAK